MGFNVSNVKTLGKWSKAQDGLAPFGAISPRAG